MSHDSHHHLLLTEKSSVCITSNFNTLSDGSQTSYFNTYCGLKFTVWSDLGMLNLICKHVTTCNCERHSESEIQTVVTG